MWATATLVRKRSKRGRACHLQIDSPWRPLRQLVLEWSGVESGEAPAVMGARRGVRLETEIIRGGTKSLYGVGADLKPSTPVSVPVPVPVLPTLNCPTAVSQY
jgi:hypothetical protein